MKTTLISLLLIISVVSARAKAINQSKTDTLNYYTVMVVGDTTNYSDGWSDEPLPALKPATKAKPFAIVETEEEEKPKKKKKKKQHQVDGVDVPKGNRAFIYTTIATTLITIVQMLSNCK
jgi:hypothetical protein